MRTERRGNQPQTQPLSKLGEWVGGGTPSKARSEFWESGTIPWVSPKDMKQPIIVDSEDHITEEAISGSATRPIPPGAVLVVTRSGILRRTLPVAVTAKMVTINQDLKALIPKAGVSPRYVAFAMQAFEKNILHHTAKSGTTVDSIETKKLLAYEIPLPSEERQDSIVAEIEKQFSRLDDAVGSLKRAQTNLKRYKAAVLRAAVEGKLTEEWRKQHPDVEPASELLKRILAERRAKWEEAELAKMKAKGKVPKDDKWKAKYKEPAPPDTTDLPELPEGWVWATLEQIAAAKPNSITDGPFGSNLKTSHYTNDGPRVIRLQNIGEGIFLDEKAHISLQHFQRLSKHHIFPGDLVIAALGESLPRACIIPESIGPALVKADCIRVKAHEAIRTAWLSIVLNSEPTRRRTKGIVHGVGRPRLNLREIKSIPLVLPSLDEQKEILKEVKQRLIVLSCAQSTILVNMQRTSRLRLAIMASAFRPEPEGCEAAACRPVPAVEGNYHG